MIHTFTYNTIDLSLHSLYLCSVTAHHKSKQALENRHYLLRKYYEIYPLFGYCCVGTEIYFVLLYLLYYNPNNILLYQV